MSIFILVTGLIAVLMIALFLSRVSVKASRLSPASGEASFPVVSGSNLMRQEFEFPRDFEGKYNLVIIPFQQIQQRDVNTWLPAAQELERQYEGLIYYELPTIYQLPMISRTFINEGMRAGIPDQTARERTITFYVDKSVFKEALAIESEEVIHLFLVDREGKILWREVGLFSEEKAQSLTALLEKLE